MKRLELLALQTFAVFCTYLIIGITFSAALEIRIYTTDSQETSANLMDFSDFVQKEFSYPYENNYQNIRIKLSSASSSYLIKKIYLFGCKDLNPVECIESGIQPTVAVNTGSSSFVFDQTYRWNDLSSGSTGNFLIMAKLDVGGKEVWATSWDRITRSGVSSFNHENFDLDRLDIYLKSGTSGEVVKNYIESYYAIPSDRLINSSFQTVSGSSVDKLYDIAGNTDQVDPSGTEIPNFYTGTFEGNVLENNLRTFDFVFGGNGRTANGILFYSTSSGPPITGGANLVIDDFSPQVVTCESDEVLISSMHVENASDIGYFQSYYYEIDGVKGTGGTVICSIINPNASIYSYECSIPVADFPVCDPPGTSTVSLTFNYDGGITLEANFPITLKSPDPRIVLKSTIPNPFDCGIDTELTSKIQVVNPMETSPEIQYTFDGTNFETLECSGSSSLYSCEIPEDEICPLLQEDLELTYKLVYGSLEILSLPTQIYVTFPPPSLGIDTVTPQTIQAGETTSVNVLLHVNYPDFATYSEDDFNYDYLGNGFQPVTCSEESSFSNIKYYKCTVELEVPSDREGVETLSFRLDAYAGGELKQLTANSFFQILPPPPDPSLRIISTSSPLDCIQDSSLTVNAKVENIAGTPETQYSFDSGQTFNDLTCSSTGGVYNCLISKDDICDLMSNSLTLILKFVYDGQELTSNPQNVYVSLPEPHIQIYSIQPNTLEAGEITSTTVNLFVQYPEMVGDNPTFLYSYSGKSNSQMTCSKVSSTSNRDFYECANVDFEIPSDYAQSTLPVLFSIQGTTISFVTNVPVSEKIKTNDPYLEIISTTPSKIEIPAGNQTLANFYVTVHNAAENDLKHQATLIPNSWISSGTCEEGSIDYDFTCDVTINPPADADTGSNPVTLTLKVTDSETFDISDQTSVYVLAEQIRVEIQSISPNTLYCEGQAKQNPESVKVTANVNLPSIELLEEQISFNSKTLSTGRFCTSQGQSITCDITTDRLMEKVGCGSGELAPGQGSHYYPLSLTFLVDADGDTMTVSGTSDLAVSAKPLEPYLEIEDNSVANGILQDKINCLTSQTIKLGDQGGYVRLMYADLLHPEPKDDLSWSFRLDAQDDEGKLTKGIGASPSANSTICKLRDYQKMGVHRVEDYECFLYTNTGMFQRCDRGEGELILSAGSGGKKAEGKLDVDVIRDDSKYQIDVEILSEPMKEIECQIQGYGEQAKCSLASYSNQNVTIRIYNRNKDVELTDLNLYGFDVILTKDYVDANARTLGNCRKDSEQANKYVCPFQIGPVINLPDDTHNVTRDKKIYDSIPLGVVNLTVYVKYANNLATKTISKLDGSITLQPKKSDTMVSQENMQERMQQTFDKFNAIFKGMILVLSFCATCSLGNLLINQMKGVIKSIAKPDEGSEEVEEFINTTNKENIPYLQDPTEVHKECEAACTVGNGKCYFGGCNTRTAAEDYSEDKECNEIFVKCPRGSMCTCLVSKAVASPQSPSDYQPETDGLSFQEGNGDDTGGDGSFTIWDGLAIILAGYLTYLAIKEVSKFSMGDEEETKSEITENLEKGIKWGIYVCVLPRALGELGAWVASEESTTEDVFKGVAAFGQGLGNACNVVISMMPLIMSFIQFYVSYLQFEMCMDMLQFSLEANAQAAARAEGPYGARAEAQTAMNMMNNMMTCFNTLMQAMNRVSYTMMYTQQRLSYMGSMGGGQVSVRFIYGGKEYSGSGKETLSGNHDLRVEARNLCRYSSGQQWIRFECTGFGDYESSICPYRSNYMPAYSSGYGMYGGAQQGSSLYETFQTASCEDGTITVSVGVDSDTLKTGSFQYVKAES